MAHFESGAFRVTLGAVVLCILFFAALAASAASVTATSRLTDKGLTEIFIRSGGGATLKTYEVNLSRHHSPATKKTAALEQWESHRLGAFVCFNTNQFTGDELCRTRDTKVYSPARLDVRTWVDAMKAAGMRYAVLTMRHTSGFLLWDSATTDFDVGSSGNTTDVAKVFTEECRRQGIAPGFYYCMWGGEWEPAPDARSVILAQLYELASNYGDIPYFWIDMMNWAPKDLSAQQVYDALKNLQPNTVVIMNQHIQDGTSIKYFPTDILNGEVHLPPEKSHQPFREVDGVKYYLPFEFEPVSQSRDGVKSVAETPMGPGAWFTYGEGRPFPASRPFPCEGLADWIRQAYARGASNVLLSLAPDHSGGMREEDAQQLRQLGVLLKDRRAGEKAEADNEGGRNGTDSNATMSK